MNSKDFGLLFDQLSQSVIGVKKSGELFFNSAAKDLFEITQENVKFQKAAHELLSNELSPNTTFAGEILGKFVSYSTVKFDDTLIIYINSSSDELDSLRITRKMINSLRNSAMGIKLSADRIFLSKNIDEEKRKKYESAFYHSYYSLNKIICNMDNADLLKTDKLPVSKASIDLAEVCFELMDTVSVLFSDRDIEFEFKTNEQKIIIDADGEKIERLVLCLISNSIRRCGNEAKIVLTLSKTDKSVVISLKDNGFGMGNNELRKIFSLPSDENYLEQQNGYDSLGMFIAMGIVKLHKGTILVESKKGEGSKFVVSLPNNDSNMQMLHSPSYKYRTRCMSLVLTELSDSLSMDAYGKELED